MTCEFKIEGEDGESMNCALAESCTWPSCESLPLNPVEFPLGPPTISGTDVVKDVDLT